VPLPSSLLAESFDVDDHHGNDGNQEDDGNCARPPKVLEIEHFFIHSIRDDIGSEIPVRHDVDYIEGLQGIDE
jgi:hypothetical protein